MITDDVVEIVCETSWNNSDTGGWPKWADVPDGPANVYRKDVRAGLCALEAAGYKIGKPPTVEETQDTVERTMKNLAKIRGAWQREFGG